VFAPFMQNPGAPTRQITKAFVDGMVFNPPYQNDTVTQSVIETAQIPQLQTAIDALAAALIPNASALTDTVRSVRTNSMKYAFRGDGRFYYDLYDIARRLDATPDVPANVRTAARGVMAAVDRAVVWNGFTPASAGSHGIAIDFSPRTFFDANQYSNLRFARETRWDDWLRIAP
jgi:hypothetical protein